MSVRVTLDGRVDSVHVPTRPVLSILGWQLNMPRSIIFRLGLRCTQGVCTALPTQTCKSFLQRTHYHNTPTAMYAGLCLVHGELIEITGRSQKP